MRAAIIIQARLNSTRFPRKMLASLDGMTLMEWVVQTCLSIDEQLPVIVATTDKELMRAARQVKCCNRRAIGHRTAREENDVLGRFVEACNRVFGDDDRYIIRVCGDNPLIDPRGLRELWYECQKPQADYIGYGSQEQPAIGEPNGYLAEVVRLNVLRRYDRDLSPDDPRREHVTQAVYGESVNDSRWLPLPEWLDSVPVYPAAVDTLGDLARVELAARRMQQ